MEIKIGKPLGYSCIGRKDQQEDAVWPAFADVSAKNHCIVLCDGVGGSDFGEVASQTSSKVIGEYLTSVLQKRDSMTEDDMQRAVELAYDELEKIDTGSSSGSVSMATTLTCVCIHSNGVLAAHIGDSRIYQIRPGQGLLYQSADHSLVNALLAAGELTPEEAKTFPRKNVITRAIQPHAKHFKAEVHQLTDIATGDYLFLCCDGVLEQLTNERLVEILSMDCSDKEKIKLLEAESTDRTKDNYTAYLIPIEKVKGVSSLKQEDEIATVVVETATPTATQISEKKPVSQKFLSQIAQQLKRLCNKKFLFTLIALIALGFVFFLGRYSSEESGKSIKKKTKIERILKQSIKTKSDSSSSDTTNASTQTEKM